LAYCYYQVGDFANAAECYGELSTIFPEAEYYQLYHSQSLYKACEYEEAMAAARQVDSAEMTAEVTKLKAAIKYGDQDLGAARALIEECPASDPDTIVNEACVLYMEGEYDKALTKFTEVFNTFGCVVGMYLMVDRQLRA
jgi:tetratricopeptide repeat protein 30